MHSHPSSLVTTCTCSLHVFGCTVPHQESTGVILGGGTLKEFLIHFGLKDIGELPSMEEFEELIRNEASAEESVQAELPLEEVQ